MIIDFAPSMRTIIHDKLCGNDTSTKGCVYYYLWKVFGVSQIKSLGSFNCIKADTLKYIHTRKK